MMTKGGIVKKKITKVSKTPKEKKVLKKKTKEETKKEEKDEILDLLLPQIRDYFTKKLEFKTFTPVQKCAIKYFLKNYDCIVQAPTGSGKTLAYALPLLQILVSKCKVENKAEKNVTRICGLILVPSNELIRQVSSVIGPILEELGFTLASLLKGKKALEKRIKNDCLVISTPARFCHIIDDFPEIKNYLKSLEILIIDEADRFNMADFKDSTTKILGLLPKQRRTGLFSATQAKECEDLMKFGLRNPVRLEVSGNSNTSVNENKIEDTENSKKEVTPSTLVNTYAVVDSNHKLLCLYKYLMKMKDKKVLVFFCSRFAVMYFEKVLNVLFSGCRQVVAVHGRKANRSQLIQKFNKQKSVVCLATDLAARGLDFLHIDAVVQFDIPKHSSNFIHRIGRAGRNNESGESLAIYTKQEEAYPEFLSKHENIVLKPNDVVKSCTDAAAEKIRKKIIQKASVEREFLELGSYAFVAMINAYLTHDSQIVAKLWDQDVGALSNSYGLLKIPKTNETRKMDRSSFKDPEIDTSTIPYKNKEKEEQRQEKLNKPKTKLSKEDKKKMFESKRKKKDLDDKNVENTEREKKMKKRKKPMNEWEELQQSHKLLKKFKKGKINKEQLDDALDDI